MLNSIGLGFIFTAKDLASRKITQLDKSFSSLDDRVSSGARRMNQAFSSLAKGIGTFTAGAIGFGGGLALANAAGKFEQGIAAVGAVTTATKDELKLLHDAAIDAGIATQFSPGEAVAGLQSLATAGQTAAQATKTLVPVLDLAAGSLGQLGVAQAAEAVVGTLNSYGMAASRAGDVTDRLLRITQLTNFQTRDFETGLAKAAASGAAFDQGLNDTLITMGLLRNRNIDASSSATAYREAVRRIGADQRAQNAVMGAGVDVFDKSTGKMRSIVDVMMDFARATEGMTDKERNRRVAQAFGARGLLAFGAIAKASYTTMEDGAEVTLKGAEAVEALRRQMEGAEGTAEKFREKLLDTFEGQKTLLKGTLQTFAVVLGEPFAAVFKPMVQALVGALNAMLRAFNDIPMPIKNVIAGVVVGMGGFLMLVGAVLAAKGALALLGIAMKAVGFSVTGMLVSLLPVIGALSLITAAVAGLRMAFQRNLGGIADAARRVWEQLSLFFRSLVMLFQEGSLQGAVQGELGRVENQGLKAFVVKVWMIAHRVRRVWEGLAAAFSKTVGALTSVFRDLVDAFVELGGQVAGAFSGLSDGAATLPSERFRRFGQIVGSAIGVLVGAMARVIAFGVRMASAVVGGFRSMGRYIRPAFELVKEALDHVRGAWDRLVGATGKGTDAAASAASVFRLLAHVVGKILGGVFAALGVALAVAVEAIAVAIQFVRDLVNDVVVMGTWIGETGARIYLWLTETLPAALASAWSAVRGFFVRLGQFFARIRRWFASLFSGIAEGIKGFLAPVVDFFRGIGRAIKRVFDGIADFVIKLLRKIPDSLLPSSLERLKRQPLSTEVRTKDDLDAVGRTATTAARAEAASSSMPAVAESRVRGGELAELEANLMSFANEQARQQGEKPPFVVQVQVDGETIASAAHRANEDAAMRAFSPAHSY